MTTRSFAIVALSTAEDAKSHPVVENPMMSSAEECINLARSALVVYDHDAVVRWAMKAIAYTHGIAHPIYTQFVKLGY